MRAGLRSAHGSSAQSLALRHCFVTAFCVKGFRPTTGSGAESVLNTPMFAIFVRAILAAALQRNVTGEGRIGAALLLMSR